jgi:hypothetical protein
MLIGAVALVLLAIGGTVAMVWEPGRSRRLRRAGPRAAAASICYAFGVPTAFAGFAGTPTKDSNLRLITDPDS